MSQPGSVRSIVSLLLFILLVPPARAGVRVETHPRQVTVFPDSARVEREGILKIKGGVQHLEFPGLPASIVESSLRLTAEGPQGMKIYGVGLKKEFTAGIVEQRTRLLKAELQALGDRKTDLADRIEARKSEIEILKGLAKEGTGTAVKEGPTHPGALQDFTHSAGAVGKRIAQLSASSRRDERAIRALDLKIDSLNNELSEGSASARERKTAEADIESSQAGRAKFTLVYQLPDASWTPLYDLRLATEGEKPGLDLSFNASVRQGTGEDWKGVLLTLSTARPAEGTAVPDPTDWWLDFFNPRVFLGEREKRAVLGAAGSMALKSVQYDANFAAAREEDAPALPAPAEPVLARTVRSEYAMTFEVPVPRDIPSDGSEHRIGVAQRSHPVQLTLVAVPRLSTSAYLEAKITYGGEQELLPGTAQLYRDGDFVGTAELEAKAPGEAFELGFGQDPRIHVERKALRDQEGKAGGLFEGGKGEKSYRWVTTIANYHEGTRRVEVREQMPRSHQQRIEVAEGDLSPKPKAEDPSKPGLKVWDLVLGPKAKAKVDFAYRVRFPIGSQVGGLE